MNLDLDLISREVLANLAASKAPPEDLRASFAASEDPVAPIVSQIIDLDLFRPWLEQLEQGLESSTLEEFQALLQGSFDDLEPDDFTEAMAQATILMGLTGYEHATKGY